MNGLIKSACALTVIGSLATLAPATAATVSLGVDSGEEIVVGQQFSLTLAIDFTDDPTLGGGIDLAWDPMQFLLVSWEPIPIGDPGFSREGDIDEVAGFVDGFAFGDFNGISGPAEVGVLTLQALQVGAFGVVAAGDDFLGETVAGCFVSLATQQCQDVSFAGASIGVAAVPVPAGIWFVLGGLGVLSRFRRSR